ncbi:MAG: helix-turn-helix domain-containing protein [Acidimicrobiales bacterium]
MAAGSSPTVRMRQLGMELRRLRDAAGKGQAEAAQWIDVTDTALSKMERGVRRVRVAYIRSLCQLYDVESAHIEFMERLARESGQRGWWADYGNTVPIWFAEYLGMETVAAETWIYASQYLPGLLQCPEYMDAVSDPDARQVRTARQKRLTDDDPLRLRVVLDEAVVRRVVGTAEVMGKQIRHLIDVASLPNITIQILPFTVFHPEIAGSFTALRFPEEPMNTIYIGFAGGAVYLEKPADVGRHATTFERLAELALDEEETTTLLEQLERRYLECAV